MDFIIEKKNFNQFVNICLISSLKSEKLLLAAIIISIFLTIFIIISQIKSFSQTNVQKVIDYHSLNIKIGYFSPNEIDLIQKGLFQKNGSSYSRHICKWARK